MTNEVMALTRDEQEFLRIVHDPSLRTGLLEHLQSAGLLDAYLQAESGTN